jgi:hypothetical protein
VPDFWSDITDLRLVISQCVDLVSRGDFSFGFDGRTAILALPVIFLFDFRNDFLARGINFSDDDVNFLKGLLRDEYGALLAAGII